MHIPKFELSHRNTTSAFLLTMIISPAIALAGPTNVPLKASLVTQEQSGERADCPSGFGGTTTGTGKSSHLGEVTLMATDCITPVKNYFTFQGKFELTASNGDKLTGDYSGSFMPLTPPMYSLSDAMFQITGGTGRFSQASGRAELEGVQNIETGQGKMEANGTVSY